jgi:DNA-binding beta-propeller fold protein YncE
MKVVVTDSEGQFKEGYDLADLMKLTQQERSDNMIVGFSVDKNGNMLCTIPTLFKAYVISRDGTMRSFGEPGGKPGKFGIVAGIASDDRGNYLVVDKLKCNVTVFDKNFNFITAFGSRGERPENLIAPDDIAIDSENRIYVTQSKRRGVNVYRMVYE